MLLELATNHLRAAFKCYSANTYFLKIPDNIINTTLTPSVWKIPRSNQNTPSVLCQFPDTEPECWQYMFVVCSVFRSPRTQQRAGPIRKLSDTCGELQWQWWTELARNPVVCLSGIHVLRTSRIHWRTGTEPLRHQGGSLTAPLCKTVVCFSEATEKLEQLR